MIKRLALAGLLALAHASVPGSALACPQQSPTLLFHSCWNGGQVAVALLPEEWPLTTGTGRRIAVTGAYTSTELRDGGKPKPVGLFVHHGDVVNPNLGRMDGILVADPDTGVMALHNRARVALAGSTYDLGRIDQRRVFTEQARAQGVSVLQSHLLIVDAAVDVRDQEGAPAFRRRILFTDSVGFGLYQSTDAVTLYDAAIALEAAHAPLMALNLDMGSYDYCHDRPEGGEPVNCGLLSAESVSKLSNLLVITQP